MKTTRRLLALLTVLALVLALGTTAFAEEAVKNNSITVNSAKVGETYNLYKLFDLSVDDEITPTAYTYTINSDWASFFAAANDEIPAGPGNQYITVNEAGAVTNISNAEALAKAAAEWASKPAVTETVTVAEGATTAVFSGLEDGYWLITSTLGTVAMTRTTPAESAVEVNEKNPENTITKTVKEDSTGKYGASNDAQIGDTVEFKSTVNIVKGTRNVVVHDTMTSGLSFSGTDKVKVYTDEACETELAAANYTVAGGTNGETFTVTFSATYIEGLTQNVTLYIKYSATLNENAIKVTTTTSGESTTKTTSIEDQDNTIKITYGDAQSVEATTTTTTHKFEVFKHAKGENTNLADAIFSLKKGGSVVSLIKIDDNNYRIAKAGEANTVTTFTTVASGNIVIWGVDSDADYTLLETKAPAGYNKLTAEVAVTWEENAETVVEVENNAGSVLPSTGGMGTTIFYVLGGILAVGALIVLVTNKRMRA